MMNYEVMQVLVADRRHDLGRTARANRLARTLRRNRRRPGDHRATAPTTGR